MSKSAPKGLALVTEIAKRSRLPGLLATDVVCRGLERAGIDPTTITVRELIEALPQLERALGVFLKGPALDETLRDLRHYADAA